MLPLFDDQNTINYILFAEKLHVVYFNEFGEGKIKISSFSLWWLPSLDFWFNCRIWHISICNNKTKAVLINFQKYEYDHFTLPGVPDKFSEWSDIHLYFGRCGSSVGIRSVWTEKINEFDIQLNHEFKTITKNRNNFQFILCDASNRTIQLEFERHRNPYDNVVHTLPNDLDHRNNIYFRNIYCHIYRCRHMYQIYQFHWIWKRRKVWITSSTHQEVGLLCNP